MLIYDHIISFIKRVRMSGYKNILGIDINRNSINIVQLDLQKEKSILTSFASESILTELDIVNTIEKMLSHCGAKSNVAVIAIDDSNIFTQKVIFPILNERELSEAVKWEIDKYVPYKKSTYYYDFHILNRKDKEMDVLIVAASKLVIDETMEIMDKLNIRALAIEGKSFALARVISESNCLLVDINNTCSKIIVFQEYIAIMIWDVEFSIEKIISEINRSLEWCKKQSCHVEINKIYFNGKLSMLNPFVYSLKNKIEVPIEIIDLIQNIEMKESFDTQYIRESATELLTAIAAGKRGIDL